MSNQSLALRGLTRYRSGDYKCSAINARGEGTSQAVHLTVRFSPVCQYPVRNIRGAERGEPSALPCAVESLPRPMKYRWVSIVYSFQSIISSGVLPSSSTLLFLIFLCGISRIDRVLCRRRRLCLNISQPLRGFSFFSLFCLTLVFFFFFFSCINRWAVNTTRGWKDMATASTAQQSETLQFRPDLEVDFGTVACWALNEVGWQKDPCLFRFFPAGIPKKRNRLSY